jgi:hypothetical protein
LSVEKANPACDHGPEQPQSRNKAHDACRLRRSKKVDPADELVPPWHLGHTDRAKVFHRHSLNAAESEGREARDPHGPVEQVNHGPQGEQHSRQLQMVRRRSSRSSVVSQRYDQLRSQTPRVVDQNRLRRRATSKHLSLCGSARPRLWEWVNVANLAEAHAPKFINRWRLRLVERMRMKRAPNEKESRALTLSRRLPSTSSSNSNEAARLPQPITASRKVETRDNRKKRHRQGRINFGAVTPAALEREHSGAVFVWTRFLL